MVNAINVPGGMNLNNLQTPKENKENQEIKEAIQAGYSPEQVQEAFSQIEFQKRAPLLQKWLIPSKYEMSVKNWYRRNVGTYPKWFARFARSCARFAFKRTLRRKIEFTFRGRGTRKIFDPCCESARYLRHRYNQDLPVRYAKKVAVYVTIYKKER